VLIDLERITRDTHREREDWLSSATDFSRADHGRKIAVFARRSSLALIPNDLASNHKT
jgi:hypothetical protein